MKQFLLFLFITISVASTAQQSFNKHNPYVSNSEIHWLRQQKINLFNAPIVNDDFTQNVRKTIDFRNDYNSKTAKFAASATCSSILLLIGTIGIINNAVTDDPTVGANNPLPIATGIDNGASPTDLKPIFIVSGIAGVINSLFTYKFYKNRKLARSQRDQQLEITKNQYNILIGG